MILHPALRYLVLRRWRNRAVATLRRLRTPSGMLGGLLTAGVLASLVLGARFGEDLDPRQRVAIVAGGLGFMTLMGVLGGIGQRGLVFRPADLDFLFPAPIPRRDLLLYHFLPHYLMAGVLGLLYLFLLGGRHLPHPLPFFAGVVLVQVANAHLGAFAAEVSMLVADRLYRRLRAAVTVLMVLLTVAALLLLVGGLAHVGGVGDQVGSLAGLPGLKVVFFPALQALRLGAAPDVAERLEALVLLLALAGASLALVLLLRVDFLESSYAASRRAWKRVERARRGVHGARVRRSAGGPRGRLFRGAGAVLWLGLLTLRRQLRAALGGVLMVLVMLAVMGRTSGGAAVSGGLMALLAMVPLWMPLPVGFRMPREQLLALRDLPIPRVRLAGALLAVPLLAVLALQGAALGAMSVQGRVAPWVVLAALPAYVALDATLLGVESVFVLRRPDANALNVVHSLLQVLVQLACLLPGMLAFGLLQAAGLDAFAALPIVAGVQALVVYGLLTVLGGRLQAAELAPA